MAESVKVDDRIRLDLDSEELARQDKKFDELSYAGGLFLLKTLAIAPGEHVLDVGCGTGRFTAHLASLVGSTGRVVGIDPLETRLAIARTREQSNLSFALGNAQDLSQFHPESFDVVVLNASFHWVQNKAGALRQFARVLKTGGRLGIATASGDGRSPLHEIKTRVLSGKRYQGCKETTKGDPMPLGPSDLEKLLGDAGFHEIESKSMLGSLGSLATAKPETIIDYMEASSFGNFLGHLPKELQVAAREGISLDLEKISTDEKKQRNVMRLFVVAFKA